MSGAVSIGPTWRRVTEKFALPERTIGYDVIDCSEEYLLQPDGPDAGDPWRFTKEQKRFVVWWYALDEAGRFIYRSGMLRRMKGWGKDPLVAALAAVELIGPCRWDGQRAMPHYSPNIQIAAVSQDQVKRNTMALFPAMLSKRAIGEFDLDIGKEIIYSHRGRGRIELLTSSARSAEGPRPTFIIKNETQHWLPANGGEDMADVCSRNAAKSRDGSTRILAISNAHNPGEESDAERDYEAWLKTGDESDFLYDSLEAPDGIDLGDAASLRRGLLAARGDSTWLDIDRLMAEIRDPRTTPGMARRFYLNQVVATEDRAFDLDAWKACAKADHSIEPGAMVTLGFDGSRTRDATGIVATEVLTGYQQLVKVWERPELAKEWEVPALEVDAVMRECFARWSVLRCYCDPYWWESYVAQWAGAFGDKKVTEFHTNQLRRMSFALKAYAMAIRNGEMTHDGSAAFARHIANAYRNPTRLDDGTGELMWTIRKERSDSPKKIDLAMAGCLSWQARLDAIAAGEAVEKKKGVSVWTGEDGDGDE